MASINSMVSQAKRRHFQSTGLLLKRKRLEQGLTQADVSSSLGYSTAQFISNWERGISFPPLSALPVLCRLYGIPRDTMIDLVLKTLAAAQAEYIHDLKKVLKSR